MKPDIKMPRFWLATAASVIGLAALIAYTFANKALTGSIAAVYVFGIAGIVCEILSLFVKQYGITAIAAPSAFILCFIFGLIDNATSFMLQAFGVAQGTGEMGAPNGAFWFCMIAFVISALIAAVAAFFPFVNSEKNRKTV